MVLSKEQCEEARRAALYDYLILRHPMDFTREGDSLRPRVNHSLSIRKGYCGYKDFATGETGNSVDFLTTHLGYSFQDAVTALSRDIPMKSKADAQANKVREFSLPTRNAGDSSAARSYLAQRGIPGGLTDFLIHRGLLYQSGTQNNLVFLSKQRDFAELRGTMHGSHFHGVRRTAPDRFWGFSPVDGHEAVRAYVCEAAIDALSLFVLHCIDGKSVNAVYCSIAGVANQKAIDKIASFLPVVLAVDNDEAGLACRERNAGCSAEQPNNKDWNEDLQARRSRHPDLNAEGRVMAVLNKCDS